MNLPLINFGLLNGHRLFPEEGESLRGEKLGIVVGVGVHDGNHGWWSTEVQVSEQKQLRNERLGWKCSLFATALYRTDTISKKSLMLCRSNAPPIFGCLFLGLEAMLGGK